MPIYLDYQATTPLDPLVARVMQPFLEGECFGNPHSRDHDFGHEAAQSIEASRQKIAVSIGARASEILFTSGATESNNTVLKGMLSEQKSHCIVAATEHACILAAAQGSTNCTVLPVDPNGLINPDRLAQAITPETALVSIMLVNNEIGVIQPIARIAEICHQNDVLLHCDAAQGLGRVPIRTRELGVDMLSLSGHKIYGPKGIGALYIRRGISVQPLLEGGGQEKGMRSGTLAPMLCAGFAEAAHLADQLHVHDQNRAQELMKAFLHCLDHAGIEYRINGSTVHRISDNVNLHFPGVDQRDFMDRLRTDIAVSSASACSGSSGKTSHVLQALGHDGGKKAANIRLSVGRPTTATDMQYAAEAVKKAYYRT